uniref:uncharacterized protein LOC120344051 n=1 Tax=Styela clava TaxID=7725 RepID=UPI00193AC5EE|nr:uncharacterized protein LOC120344051 [Styela clava]
MSEILEAGKPPSSQETKVNGNRSSSSVSPESSISTSRGSTPNPVVSTAEHGKVLDWWRRVAMEYAKSAALKQDNWMQAFHDMDMEEVKEDLLEEFQQLLTEDLKNLKQDEARRYFDRLREQLEVFENNKLYEITKEMKIADKNIRFEYLSGQFMEDTRKRIKEALSEKEQTIFDKEWRLECEDYGKGRVIDMDNQLRNTMNQTLQKTTRLFKNTVTEITVNKQTNMEIAENNIQSYALVLSTNCDDRKYYLRNTVTEYLTQERQRRDNILQEMMEKELRTLHRELAQLKKSMGYSPARRCCASMCTIL